MPPRPAAAAPALACLLRWRSLRRGTPSRLRWRGAGARSDHRHGPERPPSLARDVHRVDEALTEQVRTAMPYAATLGIELLSASPDEVRGRVAWDERCTTAGGLLHGGVLMSLADAVGAVCASHTCRRARARRDDRVEDELLRRRPLGHVEARVAPAPPRQPDDRRRDRPPRRRRQARRAGHADAGGALTRRLPCCSLSSS